MTKYTALKYINDNGGIHATRAVDGIDTTLLPGSADHSIAKSGRWGNVEPYAGPVAPVQEIDVRIEADRRLKLIVSQYHEKEQLTWSEQINEARAFVADNAAITPLMDGIATGRNISRADMAQVIIQKAEGYAIASGEVLGAQSALMAMDPIPTDYKADKWWTK